MAVAGLWLVSFPLGFHRVSRHDGVVSILRGFEASELSNLVQQAVGDAFDEVAAHLFDRFAEDVGVEDGRFGRGGGGHAGLAARAGVVGDDGHQGGAGDGCVDRVRRAAA